jgi:uncharacterized protein (TIGR02391 family)
MASKDKEVPQRAANLSPAQVAAAIPKLEKRLAELLAIDFTRGGDDEIRNALISVVRKTNASVSEIFGLDTHEYRVYALTSLLPTILGYSDRVDRTIRGNLGAVKSKLAAAIAKVQDVIAILQERLEDGHDDDVSRTLRAYQGLELHPEIARAASSLYRDGHYANAVEASVKALNGLVRLRSDLELDGSKLMEQAFNPTSPKLRFNTLADQSDKDEQRGFMMLFSGAVAGLRNPRAHGFIEDDPERALEFIAFVSLLAKLLDGAST